MRLVPFVTAPLAAAALPPVRVRARLRGAAVLLLPVLALYLAWAGRGFNYDDRVEFVHVAAPDSAGAVLGLFGESSYPGKPYYRPLTKATLLLQKSVWGLEPLAFHIFNALLAAAAAAAAHALFTAPGLRIRREHAVAGALLFALHPIASSCVYPPSGGRYSLLCTVLSVAALAAYLRPGRFARGVASGLFGFALLSKEQAVVVAPLFVLADVLRLSPEPPADWRAGLRRRLVPALLLGGYFAARSLVFRGEEFGLVLMEKPLVTVLTPLYALQSAIAPPWRLVYEPAEVATWFSPLRLGVALTLVLVAARRVIAMPAGTGRIVTFWAAWFLWGVLPSANVVSQDVAFDERYTFFPLAAVIGVAGLAAGEVGTARGRRAVGVAAALALLGAAAVTLNRGRDFASDLAFAEQWVRTSPREYLPWYSLGVVLGEAGREEEAMAAYRRARSLNPDWPDTHMNLGALHLARGEVRAAVASFAEYVRLKPGSAKARYSLGVSLLVAQEFDAARQCFVRALALRPAYPEAHHNLAVACQELGRTDEAIAHYEAALRLDPGKRNSREHLAALRAAGR